MMFSAEEIAATPVIPLWINGRASLTVTAAYFAVCNPLSGQRLRRTPLCGVAETRYAIASARASQSAWAALSVPARAALLNALGEALAGYAAHFAGLVVEETGRPEPAAVSEVAAAIALLRGASATSAALPEAAADGLLAVVGAPAAPLYAALQTAVPALLAGQVLIVCPPPSAPSSLFALAELSARCAFPAGVITILHGDAALIDALQAAGIGLSRA
jgi:succinate-semialdehyde dehydrogenase/glutarate-semialdehyde dehydrogenase